MATAATSILTTDSTCENAQDKYTRESSASFDRIGPVQAFIFDLLPRGDIASHVDVVWATPRCSQRLVGVFIHIFPFLDFSFCAGRTITSEKSWSLC